MAGVVKHDYIARTWIKPPAWFCADHAGRTVTMDDAERQMLRDLRHLLLHLHKTLLDWERVAYDRQQGRTTPGELLSIVMRDPHFAWLHPLSGLIVRIDT